MNESENIFDISPEIEEDIITQATSIIVEDFLLLGRDIPEGFTSIAPVLQIVPIKLWEKINWDTIGAVRYAFRTLREYGILEQISHVIQMVRELVTSDEANVALIPTTYERIFEQIVTRLRFAPVHTRRAELEKVCPKEDSAQIVEVYMGFSHEFEENPIGSFSKDIPLNRIRSTLDNELADMVDEESRFCMDRLENLIDYFDASSDRAAIWSYIKQDLKKIADIRTKMVIFSEKHKNHNPLIDHLWDQPYKHHGSKRFFSVWNAFQPSAVEKYLEKFLPEGTLKSESYLFDFNWSEDDIETIDYEVVMRDIYTNLEERKLLLYYFAHTADKSGITQLQKLEINNKLKKLSEEIRFCRDNYGYELSAWETTVESFCDVSFVGEYLPRIQSLLAYATAHSLWHLSSPLNDLAQICMRFMSQIATIMSDGSLAEIDKKSILANYHRIFYGHLVHLQITIQDLDDPVINEIREICETIKEYTRHKEIDS